MSRAGDVHNLPLEDRLDADLKIARPWLLLHSPREETPNWAFAYGSTRQTEENLGAAPLKLSWTRASTRDLARSAFFPARLRTPVPDDCGACIGKADGAESRIRSAFRNALGIGEEPGAQAVSEKPERGRVIRLTHETEAQLDGARFAVVVTPSVYARTRRYQQLIPIYDSDEVEPQNGEIESDADWVRELPGTMTTAILAVPGLFTGSERRKPFNPGQIAGLTSVVVDADTLRRIDEELIKNFALDG